MWAKFGMGLGVIATTATLALAAGQGAQPNRGEEIMNGSCANCHDLRLIQVQAMDKGGWTSNVDAMIQRGAEVAKDDVPVLIDYLAQNHGPMPDGPGKNIVLNVCTMCHDLSRVRRNLASREEWEEKLNAMLNEGAPLSEQDFPIVLNYLSKNFKPE
jgi:cytochrome c5